jgi:virginiamycin B lyase
MRDSVLARQISGMRRGWLAHSSAMHGLGGLLLAVLLVLGVPAEPSNAAIYWANWNSIGRANLDGTNVDQNFISNTQSSTIGRACGVAVDESHVYWADEGRDVIGRANLDGTDPDYTFIQGADGPCGLSVDDSHIFWANNGGSSIGRARLDGTEVNQEFIGAATAPCGVAVNNTFIYWASATFGGDLNRALVESDVKGPPLFDGTEDYGLCGVAVGGEYIYWGGFGDAIGRANLDGSSVAPAFIAGVDRPCAVAVDDAHVYWTEETLGGTVGRANLDGTAIDRNLFTTGQNFACGIALDSVVIPSPGPYRAPPPQGAVCSLVGVRYNEAKGAAIVEIDAAAHGKLNVKTPGLGWRVLTKEGPQWVLGSRRWRLKIWPHEGGREANRIRQALGKRGWSRLKLVVNCDPSDDSLLPATTSRKITLRRRVTNRVRHVAVKRVKKHERSQRR